MTHFLVALLACVGLATAHRLGQIRTRDLKWAPTSCGPTNQMTQWGKELDPNSVLQEFPRPQMERSPETWLNLNGLWEFEGSSVAFERKSTDTPLATSILVPFPAESCLSGVGITYKNLHYRTNIIDFGNHNDSERVLLHFGAVDWQTTVYIDDIQIGTHTGGFDTFTFDITNAMAGSGQHELYVVVFDPSDDGVQVNGKQRISAITNPGGDTYTPSSGIWQTVWMEVVPKTYIDSYKVKTEINGKVSVNVTIAGDKSEDTVTIKMMDGTQVVATVTGNTGEYISATINSPKLWSPDSPFLYDLQLELSSGDSVKAYFGVREFTLQDYLVKDSGPQQGIDRSGDDMNGYPITLSSADYNLCWALCNQTKGCKTWAYAIPGCDRYNDPMCWLKDGKPSANTQSCRVSGFTGGDTVKRPMLNGEYIFSAGWLDQSFWPDGLFAPPSAAAMKFDLDAVKRYGLNTVRLHQKVNPELWYYYADTMGIIVFQDMPQKYGNANQQLIPYFMEDLTAMINQKFNHPSIVQWTVFNEWDCVGQFDVKSVIDYTRGLDSTRLIDTNSGGPANDLFVADVNDIHTYPDPGDPQPSNTQYGMLGEYGGLGAFVSGKEWVANGCYAYKTVDSPSDFANLYIEYTKRIMLFKPDISSVIYTQITDVEEECDGYLNYDRTDKWSYSDILAVIQANEGMIEYLSGE